MRAIVFAFFLTTGVAAAEDCRLPVFENKALSGVVDFSKCIRKQVSDLETENAKLRKELDEMQKALANFPGELVNENGRETRFGGDRLTQATYTLKVRTRESTSSVALDPKVLGELCGLGCTVFLIQTGERLGNAASTSASALGPCSFLYDAKIGTWSLGGCGEAVSGTDGNGTPTGADGGEVIATVGASCTLADAEPARAVEQAPETEVETVAQRLGNDRAKGLFLIANPALWSGEEDRFRCELRFAR
jgi:hypothetical protein